MDPYDLRPILYPPAPGLSMRQHPPSSEHVTPSLPGLERQTKRQASGSPSGDSSRLAKKGRVEYEAFTTDGTTSTSLAPAVFSGVQSVQTVGGVYTAVGRDTITIHNHYNSPIEIDVLQILNSLGLPNFRAIQQDTLFKATDGTCLWLLKGEMLRIWIERGTILWGIGIPGAGKTILVSLLVNDISKIEQHPGNNTCVAFVYIRYSEPLTIQDILQSLVKQVVERHQDVVPIVSPVYARHKRDGTKPTPKELVKMLSEIIRSGKKAFFFIDALDELAPGDRRTLLDLLSSLDARLFITSRPLESLQRSFPRARFFDVAAHPSDIRLLIKDAIRQDPDLSELLDNVDIEDKIIEKICQKSGGMFLHATLQLKSLRNCLNAQHVEDTLEQFPVQIEDVYAQTWKRIVNQGPNHAYLANLVFLWILYAKRELYIEELRHLVATCPDTHAYEPKRLVPEALLVAVCCGLVAVDEKTRRVRFIHYTTRDTIEPLILQVYADPHAALALVCIAHLTKCGMQNATFEDDADLVRALAKDSLLDYAYRSWDFHAHKSHPSGFAALAIKEFVLTCRRYPSQFLYKRDLLGALHMAVHFDFTALIHAAAEHQSPNSLTHVLRWSPLYIACDHGKETCIEALLTLPNIDINLRCEGRMWTPLILASRQGFHKCAILLVKSPSIDVNAKDSSGWTALAYASSRNDVKMIRILLEAPHVDVNVRNDQGNTSLIIASNHNCAQSVAFLVETPGIDVNAANGAGKTALMCASRQKGGQWGLCDLQIKVAKSLLSVPDIDVNATDHEGVTALMHASAAGDTELVAMFLKVPGFDLNAKDKRGRNALMWALGVGRSTDVAKLLLTAPKSDVNAANEDGNTALMLAITLGNIDAVKLLLTVPTLDINAANKVGSTALKWAIGGGRRSREMVQLLLKAPGIDASSKDKDGRTMLMFASGCGDVKVVRLLLQVPGVDVGLVDNRGMSALDFAVHYKRVGVVNLLRAHGPRSSLPMLPM
ncbi:ankyrin repeat-containing domain protein [Coprinopsis sp. MPI-PUGE-AT-0042]|nr:ankyrin repeat-containing domain protein [Coprinopsis sp. MPI-PUGE-AT-0042]